MRAAVIVLCVTLVGTAHAAVDDGPSVTAREEAKQPGHDPSSQHPPPLLDFEAGLSVQVESLDGDGTTIDLSPRTQLRVGSTWRDLPEHAKRDYDRVNYWSSGAALSYDLGWARVTFHAMYEHHENEFGRGQSIDMGLEISHERKLSKNVTGFVSLMLGQRMWRGRPLPGVNGGGQGMLSVGLRWK